MKKNRTTKCECGVDLPMHLLDIAVMLDGKGGNFSHVCRCERRYVVKDKQFVQEGTAPNPFAAL